jgi:hypothetical protein
MSLPMIDITVGNVRRVSEAEASLRWTKLVTTRRPLSRQFPEAPLVTFWDKKPDETISLWVEDEAGLYIASLWVPPTSWLPASLKKAD